MPEMLHFCGKRKEKSGIEILRIKNMRKKRDRRTDQETMERKKTKSITSILIFVLVCALADSMVLSVLGFAQNKWVDVIERTCLLDVQGEHSQMKKNY